MLLLRAYFPLLLFVTVANALWNDKQLRHRLEAGFGHAPHSRRSDVSADAAFSVELSVDHFGSLKETFKNRYWINDTYYDGGPVFVYDVGEINAEPYYYSVLQEERGIQSSVMALARKYNGLAIVWEHRYYGESVPFMNKFTSPANFTANEWQYLTVDQALQDFSVFAKGFTIPSSSRIKLQSADALRPQKTPWIFVGASYPGVRAALLRIRSPEVVFASWSSSGPVQAQINMASYYEAIERALPRNCSADWVSVTKYVDGVLMGNNSTEQIAVKRALYVASMSGPGGDTTSVQSLSDAQISALSTANLIDVLSYPVLNFQADGLPIILPFCDRLETLNSTSSPTAQGLDATLGDNSTFNAFMVAIAEIDKSTLFDNSQDTSDTLSWTWQYCSQFGFYQVADPNNPVNIESTYNTIAAQQTWCDQTFNNMDPRQPNVTTVDQYGGWNMTPSNVFFSNGQYDPWRTLSINSQESNSPQRNGSETIPTCNSSPQFPSFFGTTYPNQVHGADLFSEPKDPQDQKDAYTTGLTLFSSALDQWLPCYQQTSNGGDHGRGNLRSSGWHLLTCITLGSFLALIFD